MIVIVPKLPANSLAAGKVSTRPPCLWLAPFHVAEDKSPVPIEVRKIPESYALNQR